MKAALRVWFLSVIAALVAVQGAAAQAPSEPQPTQRPAAQQPPGERPAARQNPGQTNPPRQRQTAQQPAQPPQPAHQPQTAQQPQGQPQTAQQPQQGQPQQAQPATRQAGQGQAPEPEQPQAVQQALDDANVKPRDYGTQDEPAPPEAPESVKRLQAGQQLEVAVDAGEGSPVAYGRASVVELGGTLAFTHASQTTTFLFAPTIGYFLVDSVELSFLPELRITDVDADDVEGEADVSIGGSIEPSFHLALSQSFYAFVGLGVGVRYADEPGFDLFIRPSIGLDILIGRSGILKPALFLDLGVNDGASAGGLQAGFTVML